MSHCSISICFCTDFLPRISEASLIFSTGDVSCGKRGVCILYFHREVKTSGPPTRPAWKHYSSNFHSNAKHRLSSICNISDWITAISRSLAEALLGKRVFGLVSRIGWLIGISYTVSAANPQLCPDARRGRQPTRCRCDSAPSHFTLERAICPQRSGVVWLLSTTMYFSPLEVTSFACVCVLRTIFPYVCRTQSLVCAALFKARRGTVASCFATAIPSVSP